MKNKYIFLIDSLGAFLSAFMLGIILVEFEEYFEMPITVLYYLSIMACFIGFYSLACFFYAKQKWQFYLKTITSVNIIYSIITIGLVVYFYSQLTVLGLAYFVIEILIISVLVYIEILIFRQQ